jgi:hypothetical protein
MNSNSFQAKNLLRFFSKILARSSAKSTDCFTDLGKPDLVNLGNDGLDLGFSQFFLLTQLL